MKQGNVLENCRTAKMDRAFDAFCLSHIKLPMSYQNTLYILLEHFLLKYVIYLAAGTQPRVLESKRVPEVQACSRGRSFTQMM